MLEIRSFQSAGAIKNEDVGCCHLVKPCSHLSEVRCLFLASGGKFSLQTLAACGGIRRSPRCEGRNATHMCTAAPATNDEYKQLCALGKLS